MILRKLRQSDYELIQAAMEAIRRNYVEERHHVGCAVRTGSGKIYTGVHLESTGHDVCAEPVALGAAAAAGERDFACIVAVAMRRKNDRRPRVLSPCGVCRELLTCHWPEMEVIVAVRGELRKTLARELLPAPYIRPRSGAARAAPATQGQRASRQQATGNGQQEEAVAQTRVPARKNR